MRTYGQFCALARSLDIVGDRWNLLIVRELAIRPCRYTDLLDGLPGIATNLLADRLRDLEAHGVIIRTDEPPPVAASVYRLTPSGDALVPILRALTRWGAPLVLAGQGDDEFRGRWLVLAIAAIYENMDVGDIAPLVIELTTDAEAVTVTVEPKGVTAKLGSAPRAEVRVRANPLVAMGLLSGSLSMTATRDAGATITGSAVALRRLRALAARAKASFARSD